MEKETFWENAHQNNQSWWISSGITGEEIIKCHNIDLDICDKLILDLGIGAGNLTRFLSSKNKVISVDISNVALDNVKEVAYKTYHTSELKNIEPVDLAICNLVFQHCDDNEVERFIRDINLKDGGIFSFQFAFLRDGEEPTDFVKENIEKRTHFFRSLSTISDFVNNAGKKVVNVSEPINFYGEENFSWYIVKISN